MHGGSTGSSLQPRSPLVRQLHYLVKHVWQSDGVDLDEASRILADLDAMG